MTQKNENVIVSNNNEIFHFNNYKNDDNMKFQLLFQKASKRLDTNTFSSNNNNKTKKCFWVPGRIELVGKHTDYAGGQSLIYEPLNLFEEL